MTTSTLPRTLATLKAAATAHAFDLETLPELIDAWEPPSEPVPPVPTVPEPFERGRLAGWRGDMGSAPSRYVTLEDRTEWFLGWTAGRRQRRADDLAYEAGFQAAGEAEHDVAPPAHYSESEAEAFGMGVAECYRRLRDEMAEAEDRSYEPGELGEARMAISAGEVGHD